MDEVMDCRSVSVKDAVGQHWLAIGLSGLELSVDLEGQRNCRPVSRDR